MKYKHNDSVQSILWADETSIVFTTENYEELPETKCTFWKYDLLADNITPIEEFYNVNSCIYNNYIIVVDNDWIIHFVNIDTLEDSEYDSNTKTGEMPDCFSIYKGKIIKNINDNSASYVLGYVESANNIDTFEAYKTKGFKYRKNVTNDKIVFYYVNDIDGRGEYKEGLSTPEHCDTNIWKWDEVELYDLQTEISQAIYKDETNRIIGYDYEENIVYLYSFSKNAIEAKDLDDNSVSTLSSLEKAQTIKFTWCDRTLFWIYEKDGIESYGGYLDL